MAAVLLLVAWLHPGRSDRVLRHAVTWGMTAVLLALQLRAATRLRRATADPDPTRRVSGRLFLTLFVVLAAAAVFVPPVQSTDVYAYANAGWLQVEYDLDPYVHPPADVPGFEDDPMLSGMWKDNTCVYGFGFAHVARVVAFLGGGDLERTVVLFKLLGALLLLLTGVVLLRTWGPERPAGPLFWLLLSPFVVLQGVAHAHNDVLLGLLVLLGLAAAREDRWLPVLPVLALGVMVKITPIVVLPFASVFLVRRYGWRRFAMGGLLAAAIAVTVSFPYVLDVSAFPFDTIGGDFARPSYSLHAAFADAYAALARAFPAFEPSVEPVSRGVQALLAVAFGAFVVVRFARAVRRPTYDASAFLEDAVVALFALLFLASSKFAPWYVLMVLPAALLLPDGHPLRTIVVWLSVSWMLVFTGVGKSRILDALLMTGVPIAVWWWTVVRPRRARSAEPAHAVD